MTRPISVVLPDIGPLISLAAGGALDLLLLAREDVRIVVTDMVHFEATHRADEFADGVAIASFLAKNEGRIEVFPTTVGQFALPELKRRLAAGDQISMPQDLGELSITNFVISIHQDPGDPMLVLIEDDWFIGNSYAVPGNVHLLSTASFLDGLEKVGVIPSAAEVRKRIQQQRPYFRADWRVDQEATKIEDGTEWASRFRG